MTIDLRFELVRLIAWLRRSTRIRIGQGIVNRVLYPPQIRVRQPKEVMIRYDERFSLRLNTRSWIEWCLFLNGYFEYSIVKLMEQLVHPNDVVLDVGANIGVHTLVLSRLVGENGRVFAVEPCPPVLCKLTTNLSENHVHNVTVIPKALSSQSGTIPLYWYDDDTNEGQATFWSNGATNVSQNIDTMTLDELVQQYQLSRITLIKIDVQGAEYQVLQGARATLSAYRPALIFEYDWNWQSAQVLFSEVQAYLAQFGYILHTISDSGKLLPLQEATMGEILALAAR